MCEYLKSLNDINILHFIIFIIAHFCLLIVKSTLHTSPHTTVHTTALTNAGKQRTVIIIAHRLSTIRHADQIIVLDEGKIIEKGDHSTLLEAGQTYAALWSNSQGRETLT